MKIAARPFPWLPLLGLLLLGVPGLARPAVAGSHRFTAFGPPNGLILAAVALPGQPGGLLLSNDLGGLFRSADGGHTWAWSGLGLAGDPLRALAVDPFHPGALYGASRTAFYRSANLGQSWTPVATGQKFGLTADFELAVAPGQRGQPPVLYLAAGQQLFVSHDLGATWPASLTEANLVSFTALAIDPEHPRTTAYAAARGLANTGGLLRSTDTGYLWSRIPLPAAFLHGVIGFAIVPTSPPVYLASNLDGRLFRSITGGASWREVQGAGTGFSRLEVDPRSPGTVYGFVGGSLRVSTDAGATWRSRGDPLDAGIQTLAVDRTKGTLYAFTNFDVYSGAPRFERWSLLLHSAVPSLASLNFGGRIRFDPADRSIVYVILENRIAKSADGGNSWASFAIDDPAIPAGINDLALDPENPGHLLLSTLDGLFESSDHGLTWTPLGPPQQSLRELVLIDSRIFLGTDDAGLLRSTDGGANWTAVLGFPARKLLQEPTNRRTIYAVEIAGAGSTSSPFLAKSEDGGASWHTILDHGSAAALDPEHPGTLYALQDGELLKTTDGGALWARVGAYPDADAEVLGNADLLVDPRAASTLYGTSVRQGVLRSTDGGVTWTPVVLTPALGTGVSFAPGLDQRLYADPFVPHRIYAAVGRRLYVASF